MKQKLSGAVFDAGMILGFGLFIFGLYRIWPPLAAAIGGLLLSLACLLLGRARGSR